jgi:Tfp pilus assembly protein PilF
VNDNAAARKGIDEGLAIARTPEFLLQDGTLKLAAKDPSGARLSIEEALKLAPDSVSAWEFLRRACAARKQSQVALDELRKVAAAHAGSASLQMLLGRWLEDGGNTAEARQAWEAAKKADPASLAAELGLARLDMTGGFIDSARRRLSAVIAAQPNNITARVLLGEIEKKTGDRSAAIAQYRAVLALDQGSLIALNDLAFMLSQESPGEALKYAQRAGEIAPDNAAVEDTLGWVYYRNGIYDSAIQYLKTAVEKARTPLREYHLAMAYFKSGDVYRGQQLLQTALAADPALASQAR